MPDAKQDIRKLADWIEKATREGIFWERKKLEWILEMKRLEEQKEKDR